MGTKEQNIVTMSSGGAIAPNLKFPQRKQKDHMTRGQDNLACTLAPNAGPMQGTRNKRTTKTRLIKYKRTREQDNKKKYYQQENTMSRTKKDTEAENRRTREQMIKERVQENKGTRDKIIRSSVGAIAPRTFPLREQDNKRN